MLFRSVVRFLQVRKNDLKKSSMKVGTLEWVVKRKIDSRFYSTNEHLYIKLNYLLNTEKCTQISSKQVGLN